jgi:hypothetical protein
MAGKTSKSAWTRRERDAAEIFGAKRRVLSGSGNRPDLDGDDTMHPRLWIEVKLRARSAVRTLWGAVCLASRKRPMEFQVGCKKPVVILYDKGKAGGLIVVHEDDFRAIAVEWLAARTDDELLEIEAAVRSRRMGGDDDAA